MHSPFVFQKGVFMKYVYLALRGFFIGVGITAIIIGSLCQDHTAYILGLAVLSVVYLGYCIMHSKDDKDAMS